MKKVIIFITVITVMAVFSIEAIAGLIISRKIDNHVFEDEYNINLYIGNEELNFRKGTKAGIISEHKDGGATIFIKENGKTCYQYLQVSKQQHKWLKQYLDFSLIPISSGSAWCTKTKDPSKTSI